MTLHVDQLASRLTEFLENEIANLPDGFFDSFRYTATGSTLTHPVVFGLLARFAWGLDDVTLVGLDGSLNEGNGVKFKPDVTAYTGNLAEGNFRPLFFIDYESPNSSDWRVISKDVDAFIAWREHTKRIVPYVIITTLPEEPDGWECRYSYGEELNSAFHHQRTEWAANPMKFWSAVYASEFTGRSMGNIVVLNINGKHVSQLLPSG